MRSCELTEPTLDPALLGRWLGKSERAEDLIDARQANLMRALLGRPQDLREGDALPPLWHWLYFPVARPPAELGRDGHPKTGGFLPPVALPRRMWAGGRFEFAQPLSLGDRAVKRSRIEAIAPKTGRSGALCFVTVSHAVTVGRRRCFREEHDIVYRADPKPGAPRKQPPAPPGGAAWEKTITADAVTLFRYSALTFNGHRIHYDRIYCREVEGYPDLVVHGPLIATLLADLAVERQPRRQLKSFGFRAVSPLFDSAPFKIKGKPEQGAVTLWAETAEGALAMQAEARFA